jgi:hypothetical protein
MVQVTFTSYELVPLPPVTSNHVISAFQQGHQAFLLVKIKTTDDNTYDHTHPFSVNPSVVEPLDYGENLIHYASIQHMWHFTCFAFYILFVKVSRWGVTVVVLNQPTNYG